MKKRFATALASIALILPAGVVVPPSAEASVPCSVTSKMAYETLDRAFAYITGYCTITKVAHMYWDLNGFHWTSYRWNYDTWGYSNIKLSVLQDSSAYAKAEPVA